VENVRGGKDENLKIGSDAGCFRKFSVENFVRKLYQDNYITGRKSFQHSLRGRMGKKSPDIC